MYYPMFCRWFLPRLLFDFFFFYPKPSHSRKVFSQLSGEDQVKLVTRQAKRDRGFVSTVNLKKRKKLLHKPLPPAQRPRSQQTVVTCLLLSHGAWRNSLTSRERGIVTQAAQTLWPSTPPPRRADENIPAATEIQAT